MRDSESGVPAGSLGMPWYCVDSFEVDRMGNRIIRKTGVFHDVDDAESYCVYANGRGYSFRVVTG